MQKKINWLIGCSGFHYKEWKDFFYPAKLPSNQWFSYYTQHFNSIELNVTFYRFPQLAFLQNWYDLSPDQFVFSVKVPRQITHYKKFAGTEQLMGDFYSVIRKGLQKKLGSILFQLPHSIAYTPEMLEQIIQAVDPSFENIVEFRNSSWWNEDVRSSLSTHKISFCGVNIAKLPSSAMLDIPIVYYRFHGVPELYRSAYSQEDLKQVADSILAEPFVEKAYIYFNNTAGPAALNNARWLQVYLAGIEESKCQLEK
jgi:uncharacterized protein YecE (DUF72 family)